MEEVVMKQGRGKKMAIYFSSYFLNVVGGFVAFFFFLVTEKNRTVHCPAEAASTLLLPGLIPHGPVSQNAARTALWAGRHPAPEL